MRKTKAKVVKLGSVYYEKAAVAPGCKYRPGDLTIGDTDNVQALSWVKTDSGLLICTSVAVKDISFSALMEKRLAKGKLVVIDGSSYVCRCPTVGAKKGDPNEWDDALSKYGDSDALWDARSCFFWGCDASEIYTDEQVIRGFRAPDYWGVVTPLQAKSVGFRPVLQPVDGDTAISETLCGKTVTVYSLKGRISGTVASFTDYDLIMTAPAGSGESQKADWYTICDNEIIVDRSKITFVIQN